MVGAGRMVGVGVRDGTGVIVGGNVTVGIRVAVAVMATVGIKDGADVAVGVPVDDRTDRLHPVSTNPASPNAASDLRIRRSTPIHLSGYPQ